MTGYGEGRREAPDGTSVFVRIKTVNAKSLRIIIRSIETVAPYEPEIILQIKKRIKRGTAEIDIKTTLPSTKVWTVDESLLHRYASLVRRYSKDSVDFSHLLSLPGVIRCDESRLYPRLRRLLKGAVSDALRMLIVERKREGAMLVTDIKEQLKTIKKLLKHIETLSYRSVGRVAERITERFKNLIGEEVDRKTILREATLVAERSDISEEIARLKAHIKEFERTLRAGGAVGLRLDVLTQEIQREASTIAAKYTPDVISISVVDLRTTATSIRQQVQNIE